MDAFGDNFDQAADPAADFLKREQEDLAGLEDDLAPAAAVTQPKVEGNFSLCFSQNISFVQQIIIKNH